MDINITNQKQYAPLRDDEVEEDINAFIEEKEQLLIHGKPV